MATKLTLKDLLEAGCHFGHQSRRWHPAMAKYIYAAKGGVHIFDLAKTLERLKLAGDFANQTARNGGQILFVGTKRQAQGIVGAQARRVGMPYITERWLGGLLTNFEQVQKSIQKLKDLKSQREAGELKKYTKKEQLLIDRQIARIERFLGGVVTMASLPAAVFVVDTHRENVAVREAAQMGIPIIGMVDTNADPTQISHVIPVNDDAVKSIELVVNAIADAIAKNSKHPSKKKSENKN